jgi:antitoxin (DNA-binding transcriptional repressor) of toxin-antitoxin stability system
MHELALKDAESRLAELVAEAANGEQVVITRDDGTAFQIVPMLESGPRPKYGSARGLVEMADDFDAPLEDFKAYEP